MIEPYYEELNIKLYQEDCLNVTKEMPDESIDLILTDPPYGYSFMGKDWDKAVVRVEIWKECLRVLKSGAFAFVMSAPRQDVLNKMICNLQEAGFDMGFTSIYWAYASGFPKASNIGKMIDKQECKKQLTERLGRKPTKEEFEEAWKGFRKIIGEYQAPDGGKRDLSKHKPHKEARQADHEYGYKTSGFRPIDKGNSPLEGSYGGFQPKPAVEVIIVAMKPLSEKTYVDQALKNKKGITWLDDCRIPYESEGNIASNPKLRADSGHKHKQVVDNGSSSYQVKKVESEFIPQQGRFPANLLVSDDVLNDGKNHTSGKMDCIAKNDFSKSVCYGKYNPYLAKNINSSGSFSRYFDLDKWWKEKMKKLSNQPCFLCGHIEEHGNYIDSDGRTYCDECLISGDYLDVPKLNIEKLPLNAQKTFPFLVVPKASKNEKNKGCENLLERENDTKNMGISTREAIKARGRNPEKHSFKMKNYHPTVKPLKLMSYLITLGSRPNDVVLDPFVGSGTTLLSCKLLNRKGIGIDNNKEYCDIAVARLKATMANLL